MYIRSFHIDSFGILSNILVEDLPQGMGIFLGNNEAGKSTCLEFFRTMLTGYPSAGSKEGKRMRDMAGRGGSLHLETSNGRVLRLSRRPSSGGGTPALFDDMGTPLDMAELDRLLDGVNREVYRNIYGFSLAELQSFDTLSSDAVRNALYGSSFGLGGLNSPAAVLERLNSAMNGVFKPSGKNPPLNVALREWDELKRELRLAEEEAALFDALAEELGVSGKKLGTLRGEKASLERERRELERRLGVWKMWEDWRLSQARLARLEPVADTFPLEGPARLERLLDRRDNAQRQTMISHERLARLQSGLEELRFEPCLPELSEALRQLVGRKASCRNALISLTSLQAHLQRAEETFARQLVTLGPEWSIERIHSVDRSLFVREELERRASAMQSAGANLLSLTSSMERASREREQAEHSAELARRSLESLVEPVGALDTQARDSLRVQLARVEDARQRLPEREKALTVAQSEYGRTFASLNMRQGSGPAEVAALAAAVEPSLRLAEEVQARVEQESEADRNVQMARKDEEMALERFHRTQMEESASNGADRKDLESRRQALRRLRLSSGLLQQEEDRLQDLNERLSAQEAAYPKAQPRIWALGVGVVLGVVGIALLGMYLGLGMDGINLSFLASLPFWNPAWPPYLPLSALAGYATLFVGVALFAYGLPRSSTDRERVENALEQLRSRRDASATKHSELNREVQSLSYELGTDSILPHELDLLESQLDMEREQCVANERLRQELRHLQGEVETRRRQTQECESSRAALDAAVQTARRKWHDSLLQLHVVNVPSHSAAVSYFGRVDATCRAQASIEALEKELHDLRSTGANLLRLAGDLLPPDYIQHHTWAEDSASTAPDSVVDSMVSAVKQVLENCRQADIQAEERVRATEALRGADEAVERSRVHCRETEQALHEAQAVKKQLEDEWQTYLGGVGLDLHLSPATTREALDCMERCLAAESEVNRLKKECAAQEQERDALALPLQDILASLNRQPHQGLDKNPDWLATLDILQRDVDNACRLAEETRLLESRIVEQAEEVRAAEALEADAHKSVKELLDLALAADPEHFRQLAVIRDERVALLRRCEDLEDALRLAADETPLSDFLQQFEELDQDDMEARRAAVGQRLEALLEEERQQAGDVARLDARLKELGASRHLAELRLQEASLRETLDNLSQEWSRYALARHLLMDARRHYEKERQPDVVRMASAIFAAITDGAWPQISASLEDGSLRVLPPHGDPVSPDVLSRGAQEQLYLAMRMAHIRNRSRGSAPLPVIMDDIMVNFDPMRAERTMHALAGLTRADKETPGHQVFFFTCHPQTADMLRNVVPASKLYSVEHGKIALKG